MPLRVVRRIGVGGTFAAADSPTQNEVRLDNRVADPETGAVIELK